MVCGFLKLSSQCFCVKEITFLQWLKSLVHDTPWCLDFKSASTINLQRTCSLAASQLQVLCLANKQLHALLLFKQDSFISNACTTPIKVKESRTSLKKKYFLLLFFGLLINMPEKQTASCSGNAAFQRVSKGIVNSE